MEINLSILTELALTTVYFLTAVFTAVAIEEFFTPPPALQPCKKRGRHLFSYIAIWTLTIFPATIALCKACEIVSKAMGFNLPEQQIKLILQSPTVEPTTKAILLVFVILSQPLLEEAVFRRYLFRNFLRVKVIKPTVAMILSGVLFAVAHQNVLIFLPLWFLGSAIAWLYYKTGTLIAPIITHCLFNLINVILLFVITQ